MDKLELIQQIFELCIIPLLGILTKFVISYLQAKSGELQTKTDNEIAQKYISMITNTIINCVIATNQTYVEALKKQGKFDKEAQEVAFQKTLTAVLATLSNDAKNYIIQTSGDLNTYLTQLIEAQVNTNKVVVTA